jgi:carbon dioxide concentrating mechanism protein CcmO
MVIPRLLEDLEHTLPVASYWMEDEQEPLPVLLPKEVKQKEKELIELPQADNKPMSVPVRRTMEIEEL